MPRYRHNNNNLCNINNKNITYNNSENCKITIDILLILLVLLLIISFLINIIALYKLNKIKKLKKDSCNQTDLQFTSIIINPNNSFSFIKN